MAPPRPAGAGRSRHRSVESARARVRYVVAAVVRARRGRRRSSADLRS
jgi:hypothetical protein